MIAALLGGVAASSWVRVVLRDGAVTVAVTMSERAITSRILSIAGLECSKS